MLEKLRNYFRKDDDNLPRIVIIAVIVICTTPLCIFFLSWDMKDSESERNRNELEGELAAIKLTSQVIQLDHHSESKSGLALASGEYRVDNDEGDIYASYDAELAKHDWQFYDEDQGDWHSQNRIRYYCKGRYKATVSCVSIVAGSRCTLVLTWGYESLIEIMFTGNKYRSHGCSD